MKPPTPPRTIEIMCPTCRQPIVIPLHLTMERERPDDALEVIVYVEPDQDVIENHVCREPGRWIRVTDDRRSSEQA